MTIQRLEELIVYAAEKGLDTKEQQILRSEFIYGMFMWKSYTPFRGLMTQEFIRESEDAGYIQANDYLNRTLKRRDKEGGC